MNLVDIQKALIIDDLEDAISGMLTLANDLKIDRLQGQIIHQSSRYYGNERGKNAGTTSQEQYERTRNQLRNALQEVIKQFPDYSPEVIMEAQRAAVLEAPNAGSDNSPTPSTAAGNFRILVLSSNPSGTAQLQLEKEHSRISTQIQNSTHAEKFPIKSRQAVTLPQFTEALLEVKPVIVHFSGHGELNNTDTQTVIKRAQGLDSEESKQADSTGIILTSEDGREPFFVGTSLIQRIFRTMVQKQNIPIQAVIFNSCYSEAQAVALKELIPNVIGTSSSVGDEAAIAFANGFYSFLTRTEDFDAAWENGVTLAMAYGEPEERFIYYKNGEKVGGD